MANMEAAMLDFGFVRKFNGLDERLRKFLEMAAMHRASIFGNFFIGKEHTPEALDEARELARHAGAGDKIETWVQQLAELHAVACQAKPSIASRLAAVDGLHLSADLLHWECTAHERLEQDQLRVSRGAG